MSPSALKICLKSVYYFTNVVEIYAFACRGGFTTLLILEDTHSHLCVEKAAAISCTYMRPRSPKIDLEEDLQVGEEHINVLRLSKMPRTIVMQLKMHYFVQLL
jgi:hypothetical protein